MWEPGDHLSHRYNLELGPGRVLAREGRRLVVEFPESGETLQLAVDSDALVALVLESGARARLEPSGETVWVEACEDGLCRLRDGREVPTRRLWPLPEVETPIDRLARGRLDPEADFLLRLDALRLLRLRQAGGLGSFLGGRIRLFPHQLHVAERATGSDPVRWLLADEVGLGKTVEACLVMNHLLHTRRAERVLVVAPETLVVQWLGELWRKYHQVFVLLDDARLADLRRDFGPEANAFEIHPRSVVALERLAADRRLQERAVEAGIDLLVVDEAHHLERPPGHPGNAAYRAIAPIAELGRHVLLATATPIEDDAHGFFRLLQLLRPDAFPGEDFEARLASGEPLPPMTSATRRSDVGGLPPRRAVPVELAPESWKPLIELERRQREARARTATERKRKLDGLARALASAAAFRPVAKILGQKTRELLDTAERDDPRIGWLLGEIRPWHRRGEKTLIFVAHRETLDALRSELGSRFRVAIFHEDLTPERRDLEVAQFRTAEGPAVMITTEAGGEGRNFEFCHRLVLFDLPWSPATVEQRIGRLDRIGRTRATEIVYFRRPAGLGRTLVELYEKIGLFEEPLGGLERELSQLGWEFENLASRESTETIDTDLDLGVVLREAREAHHRVLEAAHHELHREPYRPDLAEEILGRIPPGLEELTAQVVLRAAERYRFFIESCRGRATWELEYGRLARIEHIPGVEPGASFLGTFDREEAVEKEALDFFAFGHPLVEGILAELEEGARGRVAAFQIAGDEEVLGLLALYKRKGRLEAVAVDGSGRRRDDLARLLTSGELETEKIKTRKWIEQDDWARAIQHMARALPDDEIPQAVAAFRIRKPPPDEES